MTEIILVDGRQIILDGCRQRVAAPLFCESSRAALVASHSRSGVEIPGYVGRTVVLSAPVTMIRESRGLPVWLYEAKLEPLWSGEDTDIGFLPEDVLAPVE